MTTPTASSTPNEVDITALMKAVGIFHSGTVHWTPDISGLELNPKDDWLYVGITAMKRVLPGYIGRPIRVAIVGSGNGIESIAALLLCPNIREIWITDLLEWALASIDHSLRRNLGEQALPERTLYVAGRDCAPLVGEYDFIYGNLPLLMVEGERLLRRRATTTLTDIRSYASLSHGVADPLRRYSLLSQLGYLISARPHLKSDGSLITCIGGRVPSEVIDECFARADLAPERLLIGFMIQSDPEFLDEYAAWESTEGVVFDFYIYRTGCLLLSAAGYAAPDVFDDLSESKLRFLLAHARVDARGAYAAWLQGEPIGHIAYGYVARPI